MRIRTYLAALLAVASAFVVASPAHAATRISRSSFCNLSTNWRVNGSGNWDNGVPVYAAVSSPGPLDQTRSYTAAYNSPAKSQFDTAGLYRTSSAYTYRSPGAGEYYAVTQTLNRITFQIYGGNGSCSFTLNRDV